MKSILLSVAICSVLAVSSLAMAQKLSTVSGKLSPKSSHAKGVHGYIEVDVPMGFHIYGPHFKGVGTPTGITLKSGKGFDLVHIGGSTAGTLAGEVKFPIALKVNSSVHGKQTIVVAVRFQQCNDKICLPPVTKEVTLTTFVK